MKRAVSALLISFIIILTIVSVSNNIDAAAEGSVYKIKMQVRSADPVYCPRPYKNAKNISLNTSFYARLYVDGAAPGEAIDLNSIEVQLEPVGGELCYILNKNQKFAEGYFGSIINFDLKALYTLSA